MAMVAVADNMSSYVYRKVKRRREARKGRRLARGSTVAAVRGYL